MATLPQIQQTTPAEPPTKALSAAPGHLETAAPDQVIVVSRLLLYSPSVSHFSNRGLEPEQLCKEARLTDIHIGNGCQSGNCTIGGITTDGTCGIAYGYSTCGNWSCCSNSGYCGNTTAFCGSGCQSGPCLNAPPPPPGGSSSTAKPPSTTVKPSSSSVKPPPPPGSTSSVRSSQQPSVVSSSVKPSATGTSAKPQSTTGRVSGVASGGSTVTSR